MTEGGHVLAYFHTIAEALDACSEWYSKNQQEQKYEVMIQYKQGKETRSSVPVAIAS